MKALVQGVFAVTALLQLPGCAGAVAATAGTAALNAAIAAGASAHRRSEGECYVACEFGTRCDASTGKCVAAACRGGCREGYTCDETRTIPECIIDPDLMLRHRAEEASEAP